MDREEAIKVYHELLNERIKEAFEFFAPELKESEDEKIRKAISYAICAAAHQDGALINDVTKDEALAYLENQKDEAQRQFNLGVQAGREEAMYEIEKEQKPAEWSEEDENYYDTIVRKLQVIGDDSGLTLNQIDFLDKHRPQPHWKPSEEQMSYLSKAIMTLGDEGDCKTASILKEIRDDIKKLM